MKPSAPPAIGPKLAEYVTDANPDASVVQCAELRKAVARARDVAQPGDNIVLSPGCASYDQFANFEQRGEAFRQLVKG